MKKILSLFLILILSSGFSHDIRMAIFEISDSSEGLTMRVSLDRTDFLNTLKNEFPIKFTSENINQLMWLYIRDRVHIEVNKNETAFQISEIEYGDNNIYLKGPLNLKIDDIKEVRLTNTCMVDVIKGHDNIMKLKLNDRTRSFRLNEKRTTTLAAYN